MFADLGATITPEQRAALRERLRGFMRDVNELTARAAPDASGRGSATPAGS